MASVVKVERFNVDVTTSGSTHTLTNTLPATTSGFVRRTTSIEKGSGPTGSTGNTNPNVAHGAVQVTSTTQLTFYKNTSTSVKFMGEVWRYTGSGGGNDEFIVRGRHAITLSGATASQAVSGISTRDDCIPFLEGVNNPNTSTSDYDASGVAVWIDGSNNIQLERGSTTGTLTVYVTVVEFTGSNWTVGHGRSTSHDTASETITLNTHTDGTSGSTFNVPSWSQAMIIEGSLEGDSSETGLSDVLGEWTPGGSTSQATFRLHQDGNARNDGKAYCNVLCHYNMGNYRAVNTNWAEGNGTYATVAWPAGAPTTESLDELALEWFCDTTGTGTAHARGRISAEIQTASTARGWVHRSGNNVSIAYGVAVLAGIDGVVRPYITDCEDEQIDSGETDIVITGGNFEATQGTGKVELSDNADYATGTKVTQTIDSWAAGSIQFDSVKGALSDGDVWLWVTNNSGQRNYFGYKMNLGEPTYEKILQDTNPDHLWMFNNNYDDTGDEASHPANNAQDGTPSFTTATICRSNTHALNLEGGTESTSPANSNFMNIGTGKTRRTMGGWIEVDSIQTDMVCIYEEGAQIRNYCFIMGIGNQLLAQGVTEDAPTFNIQVYSDRPIPINRPVHITFRFSGSGFDNKFDMFLDGVKMTRGFPADQEPDMTTLGNHSGNIEFGGSGTTLEVGGTDITFGHVNSCKYAGWGTWANAATLTDTEIKEDLFEAGAKPENSITAATESSMQTTISAQNNSTHPDWPLTYKIEEPTDESNPTFTLTNQVFDDNVSCHVRWMGTGTLTLRNSGTSNFSTSKTSTPNSGTVSVIETAPVKITVKDIATSAVIQSARVLLLADTGGPLPADDSVTITRSGSTATVTHTSHGLVTGDKVLIEGANQDAYNGVYTITVTTANAYTYTVSGTPATPATGTITSTAVIVEGATDAQGEIEDEIDYTSSQPVTGYVRKATGPPYYKEGAIAGNIGSAGFDNTVLLVEDS